MTSLNVLHERNQYDETFTYNYKPCAKAITNNTKY